MDTKYYNCILLVVTVFKIVRSQNPTVQLQRGTIISGVKIYTESRVIVHAFLGVPYAAPPTGKLRFAPPEKWNKWNQTLIATSYAPSCPQRVDNTINNKFSQDEDCLYLNIWVPQGRRNYAGVLPTIVFLEGNNFLSGSPSRYPAQDLSADGNGVIVISISYRLNVFGFFCLEDTTARGNLGLLDQYLALLWVRENIESFGGSKTSITLMGHSAGAASVVFHMTSPRTVGLFQRAIVMSGSALSPWLIERHPANCSVAISRSLSCLIPNTADTLQCLQTKTVSEILTAFEKQCKDAKWSGSVLPVVDSFLPEADQYLPRHPRDVLQSGDYRPIPVLTGITSLDGSIAFYEQDYLAIQSYEQRRKFFEEYSIPTVIDKYNYKHRTEEIQEILKWRYIDKTKAGDATSLLSSVMQFYTDCMFVVPHMEQLKLLALSPEPLYAYVFEQPTHHLPHNHFNFSGAVHGSELIYLFGPSFTITATGERFSRPEETFSRLMKKYWTNFATKGQPVVDQYGNGLHWKRATPIELNHFELRYEIQQEYLPVTEHYVLRRETISMWTDLFRRLQNITINCKINTTESATSDFQIIPDGSRPFRVAMYTLICFVAALLILLVICLVMLKKRYKERERDIF